MNQYVTGTMIKRLRENRKITQQQLAEKMNVSDKAISKWETGRGYPDISLTLLRQAFSAALFDNSNEVKFRHIYEAVKSTKAVYPDVIKKELVVFKEQFKEELAAEGVVVEIPEE